MSDVAIPPDLLRIVLSCVPVESLLRFRCVAKAWDRLIKDPYFRKIHSDRIENTSSSDGNIIHLLHGNGIFRLSLSSLKLFDQCNDINSGNRVVSTPRIHTLPLGNGERCVSCNGLILTFHDEKLTDSWSISNPLTKEIHTLPPCLDAMQSTNNLVGFGYDLNAQDYKVVVMHSIEDVTVGTSLYSLKSNSWKMKMINGNSSFEITSQKSGVFSNGAIHWVAKRLTSDDCIVAFDLKSEEIQFYSVPPILDRMSYTFYLCELDGSLFLSNFSYSRNCSYIWLMDKYGDESSWSELFPSGYLGNFRIIGYSKSSRILLLMKCINNEVLLVNLKDNTIKTLGIANINIFSDFQFVILSFVRINGGANNKRKR